AQYGSDPARNGEPFGELGQIDQHDAAWRDQKGGPRDPQAGNSHGQRDVLRTAGTKVLDAAPAPTINPSAAAAAAPAFIEPTQSVNGNLIQTVGKLSFTGPVNATASYVVTDKNGKTVTGLVTMGADGTAIASVDVSSLADGLLTVMTTEMDILGNTATVPRDSWTKDTTPPALTVTAPTATSGTGYDVGASLTLAWNVSDVNGVKSISSRLDKATTVSTSPTIDLNSLLAGSHTVYVTAVDTLGNSVTVAFTFLVRPTAKGILNAINAPASAAYMTAAEKATLANAINSVIGAGGNSTGTKLRQFISAVQQASATQLAPAFQTLLLSWANDLLTRV